MAIAACPIVKQRIRIVELLAVVSAGPQRTFLVLFLDLDLRVFRIRVRVRRRGRFDCGYAALED